MNWTERMRPWIKSQSKPDPGSFGEALEEIVAAERRSERKTIHVKPPAEPEHVAQAPMTDADRAEMWKRTAETRRIDNLNLRAENDRLRADLALAVHARTRLVECGHEATLRRYDHDRRVCQREHVDEIDRLNAQVARLRWQAGHGEGMPF